MTLTLRSWTKSQKISIMSSACYFRNGDKDFYPSARRCPDYLDTPMCCWLNRASDDKYDNDTCTPQGLCASNTTASDTYYVDSCTDPLWGSGCSPLYDLCGQFVSVLVHNVFHGLILVV